MTIGERIRNFRNEKKLTQKQLGEKCGIDEANIRKYELGKQNPKIETLRKIAIALEVYTIDLLYDEEQSSEIKRQNFAELSMHFINENLLELPDDVEITGDILLRNFNKLNKLGKTEAFKRIEELTEIERYIENDSSTLSNKQESSNLTKPLLEDQKKAEAIKRVSELKYIREYTDINELPFEQNKKHNNHVVDPNNKGRQYGHPFDTE